MNPVENWRPTAKHKALARRARLLKDIREFFSRRDILEVETPLLSAAGNTDPEIQSVRTDSGDYLRTSPEFALKRLLASGCGDIFELGRVFRAAESGRRHNPEFTLLEWYRTGTDYHHLMDEVAALVRFCSGETFSHWKEERLSYRQLFLRHLGIDPLTADVGLLAATAEKHGITDVKLEHRQWLDLLISFVIQPDLPPDRLTFVHDFPAEQAALARIRPGNPPLAERFELYLGQTELANGYQELTDADEQRRRFKAENAERRKRGLPEYDIDERLVAALEHGLPECAGVALGVDRLQMAIGDHPSIEDVTAFPYSRA